MTEFIVILAFLLGYIMSGVILWVLHRQGRTIQSEPEYGPDCNCCAKRDTEHVRSCPRYTIGVRKLLMAMPCGSPPRNMNGLLVGRSEFVGYWIGNEAAPFTLDTATSAIYDAAFKPLNEDRCESDTLPGVQTVETDHSGCASESNPQGENFGFDWFMSKAACAKYLQEGNCVEAARAVWCAAHGEGQEKGRAEYHAELGNFRADCIAALKRLGDDPELANDYASLLSDLDCEVIMDTVMGDGTVPVPEEVLRRKSKPSYCRFPDASKDYVRAADTPSMDNLDPKDFKPKPSWHLDEECEHLPEINVLLVDVADGVRAIMHDDKFDKFVFTTGENVDLRAHADYLVGLGLSFNAAVQIVGEQFRVHIGRSQTPSNSPMDPGTDTEAGGPPVYDTTPYRSPYPSGDPGLPPAE